MTLQVSYAPISVECVISMTLLSGAAQRCVLWPAWGQPIQPGCGGYGGVKGGDLQSGRRAQPLDQAHAGSALRLVDVARHVILHTLNPHLLSQMAPYDVASSMCRALGGSPRDPTHFEPRLLRQMASHDVASEPF